MTTVLVEEVEGLGLSKEKKTFGVGQSIMNSTQARNPFLTLCMCTEAPSPPPAAKHALRRGPGRHEQYALLPLPVAAVSRAELSKHSNSFNRTGAITTDKTR